MVVLGKRLKEAREKKRITQIEASKLLGISNGTLSGYERNYRDPDTQILEKMANLYEVDTDYLLGRTDNPQHSKKSEPINSAFYKFENITDEEKEYLEMQLELFRDMKKNKNK